LLREDLGEFLDRVAYRCSQGVLLRYLQNGSPQRSTVRGHHTASAFNRSIIRSGQITVPLGWAISTRQGTVLQPGSHSPLETPPRMTCRPSNSASRFSMVRKLTRALSLQTSTLQNPARSKASHESLAPPDPLNMDRHRQRSYVCARATRGQRPLKALVSRDCHFDCRHTRADPRAIQMTAGQNVKNARRPGPIGFGFGSGHSPTAARMMMPNRGPQPSMKSQKPILKRRLWK